MHSLRHKAVHGVAWFGGTRVVIQILSWVVTLAVARVLRPTDYGLFAMALLYMGIVDCFNELGVGDTVVQRKEISENDLSTFFWCGTASGLFFYALTVVAAPYVAYFYKEPQLTLLLRVVGLGFVLTGLRTVPWNILTRAVDFRRRSIAEVTGNLANVIVTLVMAYTGFGVWALVCGYLVRNFMMTVQVYAQTRWHPRLLFSLHTLRSAYSFSLFSAGTTITWSLVEISGPLLIGKFLGAVALGYYSLAYTLTVQLGGRLLSILNQIMFPILSRLQDDAERMKRYYLKTVEMLYVAHFPAMLGMMLVADDLVPLVLTEKWRMMVPVFRLLCGAAILLAISGTIRPAVMSKGRAGLAFGFHLLCLVTIPVSFMLALKQGYGVEGVAAVWLTIFPLLLAGWLWASQRVIGWSWGEFWAAARPSVISSLAMVASVGVAKFLLNGVQLATLRLAVEIIVGAAVYVGCASLMRAIPVRELINILRPEKQSAEPNVS